MPNPDELVARRKQVVDEIASLAQIRRGSVVSQFLEVPHKDGSRVRRGPYSLYTFKEKGKTVSRRLRTAQEVETCQQQIRSFRRFQQLVAELMRIGEQLGDLALQGQLSEEGSVQKKTPSSISRRRKRSSES